MSASTETHPLLSERDAVIAAFNARRAFNDNDNAETRAALVATGQTEENSSDAPDVEEHYATQAGRTRRINKLQVQMLLAGVDFDEWTPPSDTRKGTPSVSREDLFSEIKRLAALSKRDGLSDSLLASVDTEYRARVKSALKRDDIDNADIPAPVKVRESCAAEIAEAARKRQAKQS